jgi:Flp pilus assembly pilin Flp
MNWGGNEFFEAVFGRDCYTIPRISGGGGYMMQFCHHIWSDQEGQDIAEYAVMLAVILVLVIGSVRLIGGNANNAFSAVASSLSQ